MKRRRGPGQGPVGGGKQTDAAVEGAIAVEGGVNSAVLGGYLSKLQARVSRAWMVPNINAKVLPRAVVFFSIDRYGKISNIKLETSSGSVVLDNSAISTIRSIKDIGYLPAGYKDDVLKIHYTFIPENK